MSCLSCGKHLLDDFDFCPYCGATRTIGKPSAAPDEVSASRLASMFGAVNTSGSSSVHKFAQLKLEAIGRELGYLAVPEFEVPNLTRLGRTSYLDMVWLRARTAAVAFEIRHRQGRLDVPASRKDIEKLNNMNSLRGYLVNVSDISGKAFFIQVQTSLDRGPVAVRTKAYTVESVRAKYPQAYAKWDPKEDETLTKEFRENLDIESIAKHHGRQAGAIRARLVRLGLLAPIPSENSMIK